MPFTIAIIGRPNVGKSTLFNRLAGKRLALVDDMPGLTRDRREAETEIGDLSIRLIDTAGLEEAEEGSVVARMRAQTETAVEEADLILFMIDARSGLTPIDHTFADLIRVSGKPIVVAANKCEGQAGEAGFYEAFNLGLGDPIAISAEHGLGFSEFYETIEEISQSSGKEHSDDPMPEAEENMAIRVAVVGRPNAGKSTLVNTLLNEERMITGPEAGLTRDSVGINFEWKGHKLRLFDTAGLRRKSRVSERAEHLSVGDALRAIRFAEVVILLLDPERPLEKQDLHIADLVAGEGRALVIGVNKWDLVTEKTKFIKELRSEVERSLPQIKGVPVIPLSAKNGRGLDKMMEAVFQVYEIWNRRIPTGALNRFLEEALDRHAPPATGGRRIKLRYMTQPNARPPTFVVFCSRPEGLPKAYSRYLVNGLRETFDMPGVPIRLHMRKGKNPYV